MRDNWIAKISRGVVLLLILIPSMVLGQTEVNFVEDSDVRARSKVNVSVPLGERLSFTLWDEVRFRHDLGALDRNYLSGELGYKVCDYFKVNPGYVFMAFWREKEGVKYWKYGHRIYVDLKGTVDVGRWNLSLIECPYVDIFMGEEVYSEWILATKVKVAYDLKGVNLKPYVFTEISNTLNAEKEVGQYVCRSRFCAGVSWKIDKKNALDIYYYFDIDNAKSMGEGMIIDHERDYNHIVGISYSLGL